MKNILKTSQKGFAVIEIMIFAVVIMAIAGIGYWALSGSKAASSLIISQPKAGSKYYTNSSVTIAWSASTQSSGSYKYYLNNQSTKTTYPGGTVSASGSSSFSKKINLNNVPTGTYKAVVEYLVNGVQKQRVSTGAFTVNKGSAKKTVILVDPGHTGVTENGNYYDPQTKLRDNRGNNPPETEQVYAVAKKLKTLLTNAGYEVIITKSSANDDPRSRDRANMANNKNVDLAVSIHFDSGAGKFGKWGQVYYQQVGLKRTNQNGKSYTFNNSEVAKKSQEYAKKIQAARNKYENGKVAYAKANFNGRTDVDPGNIPLVMLWSKRPWVYNESGGTLSESQQNTYAKGIFEGIKNSIAPN